MNLAELRAITEAATPVVRMGPKRGWWYPERLDPPTVLALVALWEAATEHRGELSDPDTWDSPILKALDRLEAME